MRSNNSVEPSARNGESGIFNVTALPEGARGDKRVNIRKSIGYTYDYPEAKVAYDRGNKKIITEDLIDDIIAKR